MSHWKLNVSYIQLGAWFIGGLGIILRLELAVISLGSSDIFIWRYFAETIDRLGIGYLYDNVPIYNHPPLMGYFALGALHISQATGFSYAFIFKLNGIVGDLLTMVILWKIWRIYGQRRAVIALAAFSGSILAILISAYHGNTDSLCMSLSLLAAYFYEQKRPGASGVALAAAINVKVTPILLIPIFVMSYHSRRDLVRFSIGFLIGLLPMVVLFSAHIEGITLSILKYNSIQDRWGIMSFLLEGVHNPALADVVSKIGDYYIVKGRYIVVGLVLLISIWQHFTPKRNMYEAVALCFAISLIFAPGFGIQYLIYICPFLFAISLRWAVGYSCLAGIFAGVVYYSFWSGTFPWYSLSTTLFPPPASLIGVLVWGLLIQFAFWSITRFIRQPR